MTDAPSTQRLKSVQIDDASLGAGSRDVEHEREIAVFDLLESNYFEPEDGGTGPYDLKIALIENRLAFDITGPDYARRLLLSLTPFRTVIKDYFLICESYFQAVRDASASQIEAIDMGRRGLHNEGADRLLERFEGKVKTDMDTARRLFTLICALYRRN